MITSNYIKYTNRIKLTWTDFNIIFITGSLYLLLAIFMMFNEFEALDYNFFIFELVSLAICIFLFQYSFIKRIGIIQPITIINILILFYFLVRPIWINNYNLTEIITASNSLRSYFYLNSLSSLKFMPHNETLFIVITGAYAINISYWFILFRNQLKIKTSIANDIKTFRYSDVNISTIQLIWLVIGCLISIIYFFAKYGYTALITHAGKFSLSGIHFSSIDIIWAYMIPIAIVLIYMASYENKYLKLGAVILFIAFIILVMAISRRYLIVNLFLIFIIVDYYSQEKFKIKKSYIILVFAMLVVVMVYANIRAENIGKEVSDSIIFRFINEFDAYDMLLCSVDYMENNNLDFYGGYNYLAQPIFPSSVFSNKPEYMDVYNTDIVLNGLIRGGIPTTLIGSFYLNYGLIGMIVCLTIFGMLLANIYIKRTPANSPLQVFIQAVLYTFYYDIFRVGDIGREISTVIIYLLCLFVAFHWSTKMRYFKMGIYNIRIKT